MVVPVVAERSRDEDGGGVVEVIIERESRDVGVEGANESREYTFRLV